MITHEVGSKRAWWYLVENCNAVNVCLLNHLKARLLLIILLEFNWLICGSIDEVTILGSLFNRNLALISLELKYEIFTFFLTIFFFNLYYIWVERSSKRPINFQGKLLHILHNGSTFSVRSARKFFYKRIWILIMDDLQIGVEEF